MLPEKECKDHIRIIQRNYLHRRRAKFKLQKNIFTAAMDGVVFRTFDHPFDVAQENYQAMYEVKKGDVVIDAGAYNGHLSLLFSLKAGATGRVISIEPDKENLALTQKNILLNSSIKNIAIISGVLWDSSEEIEFSEQGGVGSSAYYKPAGSSITTRTTITLDHLVKNLHLSKIDLIKMDIEGAEVRALLGAVECIRKYKPNFAIASYHIINNVPTRFAVEEFLQSHGYKVETVFYGSECITYGTT